MRSFHIFIALALVACGDDTKTATDTTVTDTATPDTSGGDTATDTATPDTVVPDTTEPDSTEPDTATPDTTVPETTEATCGCGGGATCLQAKTAEACVLVGTSCGGGGLARVDACATDDVMASCERETTITYNYFARIEGWLADAVANCEGGLGLPAGTLTVAEIPDGVGDVCSCQRSEAACVQAYGAICDTLSCDAGAQTTPCSDTNRVPGRCVTQDGQRELVFYSPAADAAIAESSCIGASVTDYYWFPPL